MTWSGLKQPRVRSETYRRHIASLPCESCGNPLTQAAHQPFGNYARGCKAPDSRCMSLCPECHDILDSRMPATMKERLLILARVLDRLLDERHARWEKETANA